MKSCEEKEWTIADIYCSWHRVYLILFEVSHFIACNIPSCPADEALLANTVRES
jgi:hypothetical protein